MGDDKGVVEAVKGPLGLASVGGTPDVDGLEIGPKGQAPVGVVPLVGELGCASDIISDEFDVANRADFHSSDVNGFPQDEASLIRSTISRFPWGEDSDCLSRMGAL